MYKHARSTHAIYDVKRRPNAGSSRSLLEEARALLCPGGLLDESDFDRAPTFSDPVQEFLHVKREMGRARSYLRNLAGC